jgi:hypothetical protein
MDGKYCPNTLRIFSECFMSEKKGLTPSYIGVRALPLLYLAIYHSQCSSCFTSLLGEIPKVHAGSMVVVGPLFGNAVTLGALPTLTSECDYCFLAEIMTAYEF